MMGTVKPVKVTLWDAGADLIVDPARIGVFETIRDDETFFLKIESGTHFLKDDEVRECARG